MLALLFAVAAAGCATSKIDWGARVGSYTYDQSVKDLGPPDKEATLSDGTRVCEWLTWRGNRGGYRGYAGWYGYGPYYGYRGYPAPGYYYHNYEPSTPDSWLRLTFGPDGLLSDWQKLYR
jgi:hypothetical protein